MIMHTDIRNGKSQGKYEQSAMAALESLVIGELGYGGQITDLSPTRVVVETQVLSTHDVTIFEGSQEEMAFLFKVAAYHAAMMLDIESRNTLIDRAAEHLNTLPKEIGGSPLMVSMMTPFLLGGPSTQTALLLAAGITDPRIVSSWGPISTRDLVAAIQLSQETGTPITQVVEEFQLATA